MRHKYATSALVLGRTPVGEASAFVTLLTPDLGLVRARVQSIRKSGAKLAPALQTFTESDVVLVKGKDVWRLSGAVIHREHFPKLNRPARERAGRTATLLLRLVHGESIDPLFYRIFLNFIASLTKTESSSMADELQDAAECLIVLRFLQLLGVDAGDIPGGTSADFDSELLHKIITDRSTIITRINKGIVESGL